MQVSDYFPNRNFDIHKLLPCKACPPSLQSWLSFDFGSRINSISKIYSAALKPHFDVINVVVKVSRSPFCIFNEIPKETSVFLWRKRGGPGGQKTQGIKKWRCRGTGPGIISLTSTRRNKMNIQNSTFLSTRPILIHAAVWWVILNPFSWHYKDRYRKIGTNNIHYRVISGTFSHMINNRGLTKQNPFSRDCLAF